MPQRAHHHSLTRAAIALTVALAAGALVAGPSPGAAQDRSGGLTLLVEDPRAPWFRQFLSTVALDNTTVATREGQDLVGSVGAQDGGFALVPHRRLVAIRDAGAVSGSMLLATEAGLSYCAALGARPSGPIESMGDLALAGPDGVRRIVVERGLADLAEAVLSTYRLAASVEVAEMEAGEAAAAVAEGRAELGVFGVVNNDVAHVGGAPSDALRFLSLSEAARQRMGDLGLVGGTYQSPEDGTRLSTVCDEILILRPLGVLLPEALQGGVSLAPRRRAPQEEEQTDATVAADEGQGFGQRVGHAIGALRDLF